MAQARTVVDEVSDGEGRDGRRLPHVDAVRAVHRRALHERTGSSRSSIPAHRRSCCTTAPDPDVEDRRPQLPRVPPAVAPPDGFAGTNDHWHQHNANGGLCFGKGGTVIGGEEHDTRGVRGARWRRSASSPTSGWCTRGSCPASSAAGASSPVSAPSSGARSAAPPGTDAGPSPAPRRQPNGDQLALRSSRLSQSSRTSSASCIHVPGPFTCAGSSVVNRPGSRSGKSTRCHSTTSRRRGAPSAAWNTPSSVSSERSVRCSRLGA